MASSTCWLSAPSLPRIVNSITRSSPQQDAVLFMKLITLVARAMAACSCWSPAPGAYC
jgi:hypothetical protein